MWRLAVTLFSVLTLSLAGPAATIFAVTYTASVTGYAFGNRFGASGYEVFQGDFANHLPEHCPNDPASNWAWGTGIEMVEPPAVTTYNGDGQGVGRKYFSLWDAGDPTCSEGNYWVDIYFGRYQVSGQPCDCPGSPSPGYCTFRSHNNCQDAQSFGKAVRKYNGP